MAKTRILIDLNVILDVLLDRMPFSGASTRLLETCRQEEVEGYVAAHAITTLYYLYARDRSVEAARVALSDLLTLLRVASVDQVVIDKALALPYRDFEDAVTMMAAVSSGASCVVTRDLDDFEYGPLPALAPAELLRRL